MRCCRCGTPIADACTAVDLVTGRPICTECWEIKAVILRRELRRSA